MNCTARILGNLILLNVTTVQSLVYDPGNLSPFTEAIYNILDGRNMQRDWIEQYFSFPCTAGLSSRREGSVP